MLVSDQRRELVRCSVAPGVLSAAEAGPLLGFASQVLKSKSDISGSNEVETAAKVFPDETGAVLARKIATVW